MLRWLSRDFLNERLVPELEFGTVQYFDHLRRYLFAQQYVAERYVLEIACGTGYGADILRRGHAQEVFSLDISLPALRYAQHLQPVGSYACADALDLPLGQQSFDVIISFETLEHLPNPQRFLHEALRVLRPGGMLILSTPNRAVVSPGSTTPFSPYHSFEPTLEELRSLLTTSGWQIEALHGMMHSPAAAPLAQPAQGPYAREEAARPAWGAYLRRWVSDWLPPILMRALQTWRAIPVLMIADAVLQQQATEDCSYFVAVCRKPAV